MKKTILFLVLITFLSPAFCAENASPDGSSGLFETGFFEEEPWNSEEPVEEFKPIMKERIEENDIIKAELPPVKLKVEKMGFLEPYREVFQTPTTRVDLYKADKFTLFADGKKELSDYMTNNFKSTMNVSYDCTSFFSVRAGHEIWYVNPNASVGAKKFYLNPRIGLTKRLYLDYAGKFNQTSKNVEQEVGFNYRPKLFKDVADFGVKATAIFNDNNQLQSKKLKFTSDWYIF